LFYLRHFSYLLPYSVPFPYLDLTLLQSGREVSRAVSSDSVLWRGDL